MKDLSEAAAFAKYDQRHISPRPALMLASYVHMQIHTHTRFCTGSRDRAPKILHLVQTQDVWGNVYELMKCIILP